MKTKLSVQQLSDSSHLPEIYRLRVLAYENSPQSMYVNRELYPHGWSDTLDERPETKHWIVWDGEKIIASARLAILAKLADTDGEFSECELPVGRPFAYWTRLVVHPEYRRTRAMMLLDGARLAYLDAHKEIKFALSSVVVARSKALQRRGFQCIGQSECDWNGTVDVFNLFLLDNS